MRHLEFNEKYTIWLYQAQTEEQSWDMKQLAPKWLHGGNECGYQLQTHGSIRNLEKKYKAVPN